MYLTIGFLLGIILALIFLLSIFDKNVFDYIVEHIDILSEFLLDVADKENSLSKNFQKHWDFPSFGL